MKFPGGGNMQNMMKQAQLMQQRLQEEISAIRVEASSGGGMVSVSLDGHKNCTAVKIDPADVAHADIGPVRVGAHDDVLELLGLGQAALGLDVELELGVADRLRPDPPHGRLHVLPAQRVGDVGRR